MKRLIQPVILALVLFIGAITLLPVNASQLLARTSNNLIVGYGAETLTVTGTQTITPTKSLLIMNNEDVLTLTLSAGGALQGDQLQLASEVVTNTVIQVTDTSLASASTISQNDILKFTFLNGQWVLDYATDNAAD